MKLLNTSINQLIFYNFSHNGDLHYSREFVKKIASILQIPQCFYIHNQSPKLLRDLPAIKYRFSVIYLIPRQFWIVFNRKPYFILKDRLYINTWIGQQGGKFVLHNNRGCTLEANYDLHTSTLNSLGLPNRMGEDLLEFIPSINYDLFEIDRITRFFNDRPRKTRAFISNQSVLSGQSRNFDFAPIINNLSEIFPECEFFLTNYNKAVISRKNVFFNHDIIGAENGDLNENSYLSTYCDIIVGRASGAFCFACTKENYLNPKKVIISVARRRGEAFWYETGIPKMVWSGNYDPDNVFNTIADEIDAKLGKF